MVKLYLNFQYVAQVSVVFLVLADFISKCLDTPKVIAWWISESWTAPEQVHNPALTLFT